MVNYKFDLYTLLQEIAKKLPSDTGGVIDQAELTRMIEKSRIAPKQEKEQLPLIVIDVSYLLAFEETETKELIRRYNKSESLYQD